MSSSVGIIIPNIWKNKSHVPNHQAVIIDSMTISQKEGVDNMKKNNCALF
jgi:hypothetical protein